MTIERHATTIIVAKSVLGHARWPVLLPEPRVTIAQSGSTDCAPDWRRREEAHAVVALPLAALPTGLAQRLRSKRLDVVSHFRRVLR